MMNLTHLAWTYLPIDLASCAHSSYKLEFAPKVSRIFTYGICFESRSLDFITEPCDCLMTGS